MAKSLLTLTRVMTNVLAVPCRKVFLYLIEDSYEEILKLMRVAIFKVFLRTFGRYSAFD